MRWVHDVATDPANPPRFTALLAARRVCPHGADYGGLDPTAHRHRYPRLTTQRYAVDGGKVFDTALAFAASLGWQVAAGDRAGGCIEATATTPFLRFKDDLVIRIRSMANATLLDVRSASRRGAGCLGANARRIDTYLHLVNSILNPKA